MKKKFIFIFLIILAVLLSQYKFFLINYAHFFSVDNPTTGADAIVILRGPGLTRVPKALDLYAEGYSKRILLTDLKSLNSNISHLFRTNIQRAKEISKIVNTPANFESVPSLKGGAKSTFDEAYDLLAFCTKEKIKHLIIVTDRFHTRRALYTFKKVFNDSGIKLEASGAANDIFNEKNWWRSDIGIATYILEPIKFFVYMLSNQNISFVRAESNVRHN